MVNTIKSAALVMLAFAGAAAHAADLNFGASVGGEIAPGVYGQVNVGNTRPALVYAQPMIIVQPARPMQPIYMNVPPGHAKKWSKHCHRYNACNRPVYFVKTAEYGGDYRGDYRSGGHYEQRGGDRHDYRSEPSRGRGEDHGNGRGDDHGHGHGNGHGKGNRNKHDH